jgi:hypothetical protein
MRVVIGPVSTDSAELWLTYARGVLDELDDIAPGECFATPEVREIFEQYVSSWEAEAATDGAFLWSCDVPAEEAEFHVHAFHQLATMLNQRAEDHGTPLSPEGGQEFYAALLRGVLSALEAESQASAEFAQHLGQFWPGQALVIR